MLLSDAQSAYDKHVKGSSDGNERKAWSKLRSSKALESRLKDAGYELRVMTRQEAAAFTRPEGQESSQEELQLSQPGAAAAAAGASGGGGRVHRGSWRAAAGSDNAFMIMNRRWKGGPDDDQPAAGAAVVNIMDGGLPSTDGAFLSNQLAGMFGHLGGHFHTYNDDQFLYVGGALAKLVYYLKLERDRDRNPAAVADEAMEYRPQPALQVSIQRRRMQRPSKRVRGDKSDAQQHCKGGSAVVACSLLISVSCACVCCCCCVQRSAEC